MEPGLRKSWKRITYASVGLGCWIFVREQVFVTIDPGIPSAEYMWKLEPIGKFLYYIFLSMVITTCAWQLYSRILAWITKHPRLELLVASSYTYLPLVLGMITFLPVISIFVSYTPFTLVWGRSASYILLKMMIMGIIVLKLYHLGILFPGTREKITTFPTKTKLKYLTTTIFITSLLIYVAVIPYRGRPEGDEPHYLLITQSLIRDHDLEINNNYVRKDYLEYMAGTLDRHVVKAPQNKRYSIHPMGISALLVPAYFLGKLNGVYVFNNFMAALLAVNLFLYAYELSGKKRIALVVWIITAFSIPVSVYTSRIYPEIISALFLTYCLRKTRNISSLSISELLLCALSLGYLPWLQQRCIPVSILLCGYIFTKYKQSRFKPSFLLAIYVLSMTGMLCYFYVLFGIPSPSAPYILSGNRNMLSAEIFFKKGLLGLLLDQENGLFIYAPVYILVFAGIITYFKNNWKYTIFLLVSIASFYVPAASFKLKWWGAWSPVGRYLVAIVPLTIPFFVSLLTSQPRVFTKLGIGLLGYLSLYTTWIMSKYPSLLISGENGKSKFLSRLVSEIDLTRYWSSFIVCSHRNYMIAFLLLIMIILFNILLVKRKSPRSLVPSSNPTADSLNMLSNRYIKFFISIIFTLTLAAGIQELFPYEGNYRVTSFKSYFKKFYSNIMFNAHFSNLEFTSSLDTNQPRELIYNINRFSKGDYGTPRFICSGPYITLPAGTHVVDFYIWAEKIAEVSQYAYLDVATSRGKTVLARKYLLAYDFENIKDVKKFRLTFNLDKRTTDIETRIFSFRIADMYAEKIVIDSDLNNEQKLLQKALKYEKYGYWKKAADIYEQIQNKTSAPELVDLNLGIIYGKLEKWKETIQTLQPCKSRFNNNAELKFYLGKAHYHTMNYTDAINELLLSVNINPNYYQAYLLLEKAYTAAKDRTHSKEIKDMIQQRFTPEKEVHCSLNDEIELFGITSPFETNEPLLLYFLCKKKISREYKLIIKNSLNNQITYHSPPEWGTNQPGTWIPGVLKVVPLMPFHKLSETWHNGRKDNPIALKIGVVATGKKHGSNVPQWCNIGTITPTGSRIFLYELPEPGFFSAFKNLK